ncbi:MAG: TRAP transporter small permease [Synergistaceae bacterium]|nr:TRAP transporter small permease [Synergistaceae bacterium]
MFKWLDEHFEEVLMVIFLILIACVMMLQVVVRKIPFIQSLTWAEEFSRFMWIMSVFISLPYTIRKANMLRVSVVLDLFPQSLRKVVNLCVDVIVAVCMALLAYHSIECLNWSAGTMLAGAKAETSPAMGWPMWWLYAVAMFGFALGTLRAVQMFFIHLKNFNVRELTTLEQTQLDAKAEAEAGLRAEGGK